MRKFSALGLNGPLKSIKQKTLKQKNSVPMSRRCFSTLPTKDNVDPYKLQKIPKGGFLDKMPPLRKIRKGAWGTDDLPSMDSVLTGENNLSLQGERKEANMKVGESVSEEDG